MEGVWLAHPPLAKLAQTLIADWKQKLPLPEYVPAKPITHDSILVWSLQPKDTMYVCSDVVASSRFCYSLLVMWCVWCEVV